jgi:hypothetical protein
MEVNEIIDKIKITDKPPKRKMNPKSLANLKPFQKHNQGNLDGRPPKQKCLINIIEYYLTRNLEQLKKESEDKKLDLAHRIAIKYILDCHNKPGHTDKLMDRLYGTPQSAVDVTTKGESIKNGNGHIELTPSEWAETLTILAQAGVTAISNN